MLTLGARTFSPLLVVFAGYLWVYRHESLTSPCSSKPSVSVLLETAYRPYWRYSYSYAWCGRPGSWSCVHQSPLGRCADQRILCERVWFGWADLSTHIDDKQWNRVRKVFHLPAVLCWPRSRCNCKFIWALVLPGKQSLSIIFAQFSNAKQHQCLSKRLWFLLGPACRSIENQ